MIVSLYIEAISVLAAGYMCVIGFIHMFVSMITKLYKCNKAVPYINVYKLKLRYILGDH